MSSPVAAELEAGLQFMQGLKPPGVSGSRITALTALCVANVQYESVLIQKLYTHFKKAPGTHKLGVLYVVDSVTRKWLDQAKQHGQTVNGSAPDGTYAAGVNRVTELIPVLMNDILSSAPADQKDKIKKLVDIWEKGQTFPANLIQSFREKLNASSQNDSTTPDGSPPPNGLNAPLGRPPAAPSALPPNIMETLANLAKQSSAPAAAATATPPTQAGPFGQPNNGMPPYSQPYSAPAPVNPQPVPFQAPPTQPAPFSLPFGAPASAPAPAPAPATTNLASLASLISAASQQQQPPQQAPPPPQPQAPPQGLAPNVQQNLMLIQALLAQGLSAEQITGILGQMAGANAGMPAAGAPPSLVPSAIAAAAAAGGGGGASAWPPNGGAPSSSDWGGGDHGYGGRSPSGVRGRSRSRSPRHWDGHGSPRSGRRGSPGRDHDRERGGRGRDYRQRSPVGGRRGGDHSPPPPPAAGDKWVEHDPSLPHGTIRVLSRTLFVGGVTISEAELRQVFSRFGDVQTCIVNKEKRHAFVKMFTRRDAEAAKAGMDARNDESGLRTRWGVGFGPRDCSDYSKGISVIPITKLTEADRKWLLTAVWGGSGGRPIATGLVVEEPDIEIGAGVSSKAISRRMQTDRGGINGPRSTRREEELAHAAAHANAANASANAVPVNPHGSGSGGGRRRGGASHRGGGQRGGGHGGDDLGYGGGHDGSSSTPAGNSANGSSNSNGNGNSTAASNGAALAGLLPYGLQIGANGVPVFPQGFSYPAPEQPR